jgi:hypothetical protein
LRAAKTLSGEIYIQSTAPCQAFDAKRYSVRDLQTLGKSMRHYGLPCSVRS